jgi:hypothetical protein
MFIIDKKKENESPNIQGTSAKKEIQITTVNSKQKIFIWTE